MSSTGAYFANDFSLAIKIWWKFHFALNQFPVIRSQHNFVHAMTAQLSWYVQTIVAIVISFMVIVHMLQGICWTCPSQILWQGFPNWITLVFFFTGSGQSSDWPSPSEVTLNIWVKLASFKPQQRVIRVLNSSDVLYVVGEKLDLSGTDPVARIPKPTCTKDSCDVS